MQAGVQAGLDDPAGLSHPSAVRTSDLATGEPTEAGVHAKTRGAAGPSMGAEPVVLEDLVLEDLLVEDVSIDGMCGVY